MSCKPTTVNRKAKKEMPVRAAIKGEKNVKPGHQRDPTATRPNDLKVGAFAGVFVAKAAVLVQ